MEKKMIMIVEDEAAIATSLELTLRDSGYTVSSVIASGEEAVIKAEEDMPDIVLMDIMLAGKMNGIEAAKLIRENCGIPIIFLTSYSDKTLVEMAKASNPLGYLVKPFHKEEISTTIEVALLRHGLETELNEKNAQLEKEIIMRKSAEQSALASKNLLKNVFDAIQDGICVIDSELYIADCNSHVEKCYQDAMPIVGKKCYEVCHQNESCENCPTTRALEKGTMQKEIMPQEIPGEIESGWVEVYVYPIFNSKGKVTGVVKYNRDITKQVNSDKLIAQSLKEKETLLLEIHHRVKNNMQIISSLLGLQARYIRDEKDRELFLNTQNRIHSMAIIHEKLYESDNLSEIEFSNYIRDLSSELLHSYNSDNVELKLNAEEIFLDIEKAIPCALIINELVSNSIKYAFPDGKNGSINIEFRKESSGEFLLDVGDNGVGFSEEIDLKNIDSLGLSLVHDFTKQLRGEIEISNDDGAKFSVRFPG